MRDTSFGTPAPRRSGRSFGGALFLCLTLASAGLAWAVPTVEQVQAEVRQGRTSQAEDMMREVVGAKPDSAKAHYIYAELLARNGKFALAETEAGRAQQIDPAIRFTQPEKFRAFQQLLEREQRPAARTEAPARRSPSALPATPAPTRADAPPLGAATQAEARSGGLPSWLWIVALAAVGWGLWRAFARRSAPRGAAAAGAPFGAGGYAPGAMAGANGTGFTAAGPNGPMGAPYGAGMQAPGMSRGGGLMGVGLAAAGGVAAGVLVDQMLHRNGGAAGAAASGNDAGAMTGGLIPDSFGSGALPANDAAARELESRDVDFGSGGDWDSGSGAADVDMGSSSDDWS